MGDNTGKKIAVGALLAGAVGYVAGILTAPKSGRETRRDIQAAASKARTEAGKNLKRLSTELGGLLEQSRRQSGRFTAGTKRGFNNAVKKAQSAQTKARNILSAFHEGDAEDKDLKTAVTEVSKAIDHLKKYLKKPPTKSSAAK